MIKHVVSVPGYIQIGQTIIVKVSYGNPHPPATRRQPGGVRHIGEVNLPGSRVLMVEGDHRIASMKILVDGGVIHDSHV